MVESELELEEVIGLVEVGIALVVVEEVIGLVVGTEPMVVETELELVVEVMGLVEGESQLEVKEMKMMVEMRQDLF